MLSELVLGNIYAFKCNKNVFFLVFKSHTKH